jgi:outer membrane protein assembly factor BamB
VAIAGCSRAEADRAVAGELAPGADWPMFLGPHGTGVSDETGLATRWPAGGPPILWEKSVGTGYSAPSIRDHRLVLHHRLRDEEIVECFDVRDGQSLWEHSYASRFEDPYGYNNGPRCSPLLTDTGCYTYGAEGRLVCTELATGREIWARDVLQDFDLKHPDTGLPNWFFGIGCTPILEGDLLIALVGGQPNSGVVAFDPATGKTVWEAVGRDTWDGVADDSGEPFHWSDEEQVISYASPFAATIHGRRHLLCLVRQGLVSLDPKTGQENFKYWFRSRSFESVNAARPLVIGDKIFLTAAYQLGSALLQVHPDGKSFTEVWRDRRNMLAHWSTPIEVNGCIYGFSGRHEQEATFRCLRLEDGEVAWETTGYTGALADLSQDPVTGELRHARTGKKLDWPFLGRGSKIQVGDQFIALGERGTLALVNINPEKYDEVARTSYRQIRYPAWTAPVLSRQRLYLRDEDSLLCLDVSKAIEPKSQPESRDARETSEDATIKSPAAARAPARRDPR